VTRRWPAALRIVVTVVVLALVARALVRNWSSFRSAGFAMSVHPGWLLLSFASLGVVSFLQIESWRRILAGWGQSLAFWRAARIWFLANLGRYVPGKVWSVAGMVVMAKQEGVQPWAAAASAVAVQALGLGTAAAVVAATIPGAASGLRLAVAAVLSAATIGILAWERGVRRIARLAGQGATWRALPPGTVILSTLLTAASWVAYGAAFWLLARGLGLPGRLAVGPATGTFALAYVVGLLVLFAPGGIGFREGVLSSLLSPQLGLGGALGLSVASRLQLTLVEAGAGVGALLIGRHKETDVRDAIRG
jgi:uncharacterized membrane protein YbhN (UPF0104 family)